MKKLIKKIICPKCGKIEYIFTVLPIIESTPCIQCQLKERKQKIK